jgi:hypothetical protein
MNMSIDWKCSVTISILTVLVYLLLVTLLKGQTGEATVKEVHETEWFKSMEFMLFLAAFIAFNLNKQLFNSC